MKAQTPPTRTGVFLHSMRENTGMVESSWNVTAHAQKPDFVFRAKRTSPFKSAGGRQFSRLLAAEVCASAAVMLDTPCCEVVWRILATQCIRQFPLQFVYRASPSAITFQLESTSDASRTHVLTPRQIRGSASHKKRSYISWDPDYVTTKNIPVDQ